MTKAEWDSLFYSCFEKTVCGDEGGGSSSLALSDITERRLQRNSKALKIDYVDSIPEVGVCDLSRFVEYIENRGFEFLTKTEWQQSFIYHFITDCFLKKSVISLSTNEIYIVADFFKVDFTEMSLLIKKTYRLDNQQEVADFGEFVDSYLQHSSFEIKDGYLFFEVTNPLVKDRYLRFLRSKEVFSDYSFNPNIVKVSANAFYKCVNNETKKGNRHITTEFIDLCRRHFSPSAKEKETHDADFFLKEIENSVAENFVSTIFKNVCGNFSFKEIKQIISVFK